ncbi:CYTH domain-containing protein [Bacillus sp. FJAT-45037]|uniref:CYTH domain-containing protein n=1 Tax=Bacillus sp. FJAT-45037 TaxID=2011007 RepID=UPI000C23092F|nr:CYTH domain-containing protein [Bacillus sp. FJAT-45037]
MSQEIEIEVKSLVNEKAFYDLLSMLQLSMEDASTQRNHYFETQHFHLKEKKSALRIREKNNTYTFTLKQPHSEGLLETHQKLTKSEATKAIETGYTPPGEIHNQLITLNIEPSELMFLGTLTTRRLEISYEDGLLCFDHSTYLDQEDYELEFEGHSLSHASDTIKSLFLQANVEMITTPNKVQRFFNRKQQINRD